MDPYDKRIFKDLSLKESKPTWTLVTVILLLVRIVSSDWREGVVSICSYWGYLALCHPVYGRGHWVRQTLLQEISSGVYDTGTLLDRKQVWGFEPLPTFTPEIFMRISAKNVMKQKSFHKGIEQLVQEEYYGTSATKLWWVHARSCRTTPVWSLSTAWKSEYNAESSHEPDG